jgi:hypothetical protein
VPVAWVDFQYPWTTVRAAFPELRRTLSVHLAGANRPAGDGANSGFRSRPRPRRPDQGFELRSPAFSDLWPGRRDRSGAATGPVSTPQFRPLASSHRPAPALSSSPLSRLPS